MISVDDARGLVLKGDYWFYKVDYVHPDASLPRPQPNLAILFVQASPERALQSRLKTEQKRGERTERRSDGRIDVRRWK